MSGDKPTCAERIASALMHDPSCLSFGEIYIHELAMALDILYFAKHGNNVMKYEFTDGSCIIVIDKMWGFGASDCMCCWDPLHPDAEPVLRCVWHSFGVDDDE